VSVAGEPGAPGTAVPATVLIVEDEAGLREGLASVVEAMGHRPLTAAGLADARAVAQPVDCVLLDIRLRDGDGLDYLGELRRGPRRDVPVVMVTAYGDSERTIRAMRDGAFDYLTKPFELPALKGTIERALKQRALAQALAPAAALPRAEADLLGTSAAMLEIWKLIGRAAASQAPVLITGETGTGKELVARAIHAYATRSGEPFVAVNLAALPSSLIESEVFGHEKGAFTGATARRSGRFEVAGRGTLFLDEIGDLDAALQTKLLRVLQDGTYERVGGTEPLVNQARIVTATNKPVRPDEDGRALREELYYRLAVIEIGVPPLRARRSDIPMLVARALHGTPARAVSEEAMALLSAHPWPGNVRELFHVVQRAAVLCGGEVIDVPNLPENVRPAGAVPAAAIPSLDDGSLTLREAVASLERRLIQRALERAAGNRSEAARQLGIGRPLLYAKMEQYGLARGPRDPSDP
jgi:two-component system response regulator AtoC